MRRVGIALLAFGVGCASKARVEALEVERTVLQNRLAELEQRVELLEKKSAPQARGEPSAEDAARSQQLRDLMTQAQEAMDRGEADKAKALVERIRSEYGDLPSARAVERFASELEVVGTQVPDYPVETWIQGSAAPTGTQIVVFFEEWCPHCRREVPAMQARYGDLQSRGVEVVGFTRLTRSSTRERLDAFLAEHGVSFPVGKERMDELTKRYNVRGIPAAMVVKNGTVVWRGHPGRLTDEVVDALR